MFKSENLIKIFRFGIHLALLAPLVYIPQAIFGSVFGKMIYFQVSIELIFPFFVYLIFFRKDLRPKFDVLTKLILSFFFIVIISSIFGVDWQRSFWGYPSRMRGIFTLLHILLLYFYIITAFRTEKEKKRLIIFVLAVGLVMAIFGFFERLYPQLNIDKISIKASLGHRVMSTTGNPIFFAGFLLFMVFLSIYYYFVEEKRYRWLGLAGGGFFTLVLLYTGTRAALAGLIAGMIFASLYFIFQICKKKKIAILGGIVFITILSAGIFGLSKIKLENNFLNFKQITQFSLKNMDGSISGRLLLWKLSRQPFKERWLLGWGLENFEYVFNKYYDPHFLINGVNETFSDRAHNIFIDFAIMAGASGLLLFLALFIYPGIKLLKNDYFKKENAPLFGLLTGVPAYMFFAIDSPEVSVMLFFFLAILYFVFNKNEKYEYRNPQIINRHIRAFVFSCFCVFVLFGIYFYNIKPLYAGISFINYKKMPDANAKEKKDLVDYFFDTPIYKNEFAILFGNQAFFGGRGDDADFRQWEIDKAIAELSKSPFILKDFSYPFLLGNLYLRKGSVLNAEDDFKKAIEYFKKALRISPKRQSVMFQQATALAFLGNTGEAVDILKKAVTLDDSIGLAHWRLGMAYFANNEKKEAYKALKKAFNLNYYGNIEEEQKKAAKLCEEMKDDACVIDLVISIYRNRLEKEPGNADYYLELSNAYDLKGEPALAKEFFNKAKKN